MVWSQSQVVLFLRSASQSSTRSQSQSKAMLFLFAELGLVAATVTGRIFLAQRSAELGSVAVAGPTFIAQRSEKIASVAVAFAGRIFLRSAAQGLARSQSQVVVGSFEYCGDNDARLGRINEVYHEASGGKYVPPVRHTISSPV
jgi:hypothetical protein